ncbi:hypothetical protein E4N71_11185 [Treponema vincentii]|uniref:hypothetical protein n=1 Tax=Treponema vincentii TaxID=69710 RepID=UPI003D94262A
MKKADFENYMKFKKAAEENAAKIEKILNENGYTVVRAYNPEVIEGMEGKPELITNLIVSQEFPID